MTAAGPRPEIYVDADACPVKAEVAEVAARHGLRVTFVANGGLRPSRDPMVRNIVVGGSFDAADDWIVGALGPGDLVVTADVPLAKRCIDKGGSALGPTGRLFTTQNIGTAVAMRDLNQTLRESGAIKGYNAAFSGADRSRFRQALELEIRKALNRARREPGHS
jgi:uncharacterized protein YaiI (UPF0178 family)